MAMHVWQCAPAQDAYGITATSWDAVAQVAVSEVAGAASNSTMDAESCCGDSPMEQLMSLQQVDDMGGEAQNVERQQGDQHGTCRQSQCSGLSSNSSQQCSDTVCGDDFECIDASMLLEDASNEYPGGVDAALADWAAACSSHTASASASLQHADDEETMIILPTACWQQQQQQQQQARQQSKLQHCQGQAPHRQLTLPSLAAVVLTQTQPPCLAASLLPCCQWGAFEGDVVGEVLAGRAPAPSCCTSLLHL